jgi:hypothetical protein
MVKIFGIQIGKEKTTTTPTPIKIDPNLNAGIVPYVRPEVIAPPAEGTKPYIPPPPKPKIGGGGSSSLSTSPTIDQSNIQNAMDVPSPQNSPTNVVKPAVATTGLRNAVNYFKQNIGRENVLELVKGTGQIAFAPKTGGLRDRLTNKVSTSEQNLTSSLTKGFPSSRAESNYTSTVNDFNLKSDNLNRDIQSYEAEVNKYPDGAPPDVYARLTAKQDELNSRIANQTAIAKDLEQVGVKLKSSNTLSKVGVGVVEGVIGTIAFFPKLVLHPVKIVKETVGGLTQLPQSIYDQPARTTGGLIGSIGTGWLIGKVSGRLINGKPVDTIKLNTALEGAKLTPVKLIETTSESKIKYYKLEPDVEAQALTEIKAGRSVKIQESKITNPDPIQQKIIDKGLGKTKIISLDVVNNIGNTIGNTIARRTFIGVEIKKGIFTYKETTFGKGTGIYNPDLNTAVIDTNFLGFNKKGQPVNAFKDRNVIKFNQPVYDVLPESYKVLKSGKVELLNEAQILRLVKANSYNIEGSLKVRAPPKQPITFKNYQDVISAEFNRIPSSKTRSQAIQSLTGIEVSDASLTFGGKGLGAVGRELTFKTLVSESKTTKIPKPFEYNKVFSKSSKPFDIKEELNIKALEQPKTSPTSQILEQPKPIQKTVNTFDVGQLPELDLTKQIKQSVQFGAKEVNKQIKVKPFILPPPFQSKFKPLPTYKFPSISKSKLQLTPEQNKLLSYNTLSDLNLNVLVNSLEGLNQMDVQIQSPRQIEQQIQKLNQVPKQITKPIQTFNPYIPTPVIPNQIISFPILPSFQQGGGQQTFNRIARRNRKPTPKYTASLSSAEFNTKPLKVTKAQLEKLNKVVFSGAEARPTLQLISDEEMKKGLKKVNF